MIWYYACVKLVQEAVYRYPAVVVLMRRIIRRNENGIYLERRRRHGIAIRVKQKGSTVSRYVYECGPGASDLLSNMVRENCAHTTNGFNLECGIESSMEAEVNEGGDIKLEPPVTR